MQAQAINKQQFNRNRELVASLQASRMCLVLQVKNVADRIENSEPISDALRERFCEALVDYVAMGHFGLYEQIFRPDNNLGANCQELAKGYFPLMMRGTKLALLFNDHHSIDRDEPGSEARLFLEFSELGLMLSQRFEAEDQLLKLAGY